MTKTCDCGAPAKYSALSNRQLVGLCEDCYAAEYPERSATFALARRNPKAGEFRDPAVHRAYGSGSGS